MCKKTIALLMSLTLLLAVLGVNVSAATSMSDLGNSKALRLSDNTELFTEIIDSESVDAFNKDDIGKYSDYEVILVDNNTLSAIDSTKLVELIDNGTTLWVEDNNLSLKEVSKVLNLDEPDDRFVRGAQVTGAFIFNQNNNYCFGVVGVIDSTPVDWDNQMPQEKENDDSGYEHEPIPIYQSGDKFENSTTRDINAKVELEDFTISVDKFRSDFNEQACKEIEPDAVYMQLPTKGFNGSPYYNYFTFVQSGWTFGSATITQYRYDICTYQEGKTKKKITDIVSNFTISPIPTNIYVNNYRARMHANISNMNVIGQSYLNSSSSSSYTLSGGFSYNGTVLTGNAGASTTNTYSTNNQTITNGFAYQKYKDWTSNPTKKWKGASWELEPCIRIQNTNATSYKCQAYSSFQAHGWIGVVNVIGANIPFVEVGGAWNP